MANLPAEFTEYTRQLMGEERFGRYLKSFEEEPPVSIRPNPMKIKTDRWQVVDAEPVPWCRNAYYLKKRPNFTFDPLFHAGCYYVQEAASMFLDEVLRQSLTSHLFSAKQSVALRIPLTSQTSSAPASVFSTNTTSISPIVAVPKPSTATASSCSILVLAARPIRWLITPRRPSPPCAP